MASRATACKWVHRFRDDGIEGLENRSSAPHARRGPTLGHPRSTVCAVLRRYGLTRLAHLDRQSSVPIRYERERPGELVHLDVEKLGKVPPGGGHRTLGRASQTPRTEEPTTSSTSRSMTARARPEV